MGVMSKWGDVIYILWGGVWKGLSEVMTFKLRPEV